VDDAGSPALVTLGGTDTLRLLMTGTAGEDNRKTMLNYIMLVQAPVIVLSSATVNGIYTEETNTTVDISTRSIKIPTSGSVRFYQLNSTVAFTIKSISVSANTVTLTL